ncbi:MAG: hypothetical protein IJ761_07745 [Bacteroidales bacterium]|nr:hypothetical protein [Bacteroidales bacterium]
MALSLKKLFGSKQEPTPQGLRVAGTTATGDIVVSQNVNWKMIGITEAGQANGDITAYRAGFTSCFHRVRHSQELDQQLQDQMKQRLNSEKIAMEGDLSAEQGKQENTQQKLDIAKHQVATLRLKLDEAQHGMVNREKTVRLNFLIGVTIVALLTIYLFIFYSSTAYSAFFRDFDVGESLNIAMFDGNAVVDAFRSSFFEGCFCLFMPVIFLALGYVAHGFSIMSKGFERYLKTILLYLITFAFDFLLAYKISKAFYDTDVVISFVPLPPYSIKLAFSQEDFWIVIFCGFVSYVIWGLAFSFVMNCYDRLTNNKYEIEGIRRDLDDAQSVVDNIQKELSTINQKIAQLKADIKKKENELLTHVRYDYALIEKVLADHYQGWAAFFAMAERDTKPLKEVYEQELDAVHKWMNKE